MHPYLGHTGGEDVPLDVRYHLVVHVPHGDGGGVWSARGDDVQGDAPPLVGVETHTVHLLRHPFGCFHGNMEGEKVQRCILPKGRHTQATSCRLVACNSNEYG